MTLTEIREKARKFQRKILFRNLREYAAIAVVVVFFGFGMGKYPPWMRAGAGLCIAGGLYVAYQLHPKGLGEERGGGSGPGKRLEFHRRELERQRDLVRGVWAWYLGPLIPGLALMVVAAGIANPGHLKHVWRFVGLYSFAVGLLFYFVARLNLRAARRLQRRIDELDAMRS